MSVVNPSFSRISRVLEHIHAHLDQALPLDQLASLSCWSRWQLQRVFMLHTGLSVAQYIRELRLSKAAELLLDTPLRQLDIALACGFESEISFSRSFRQMFGCPPGQYRQRGERIGLRTPLRPDCNSPVLQRMVQVRIETRPAFELVGVLGEIAGLYAANPDFKTSVPGLWQRFTQRVADTRSRVRIGVLDVRDNHPEARIPYWAGVVAPLANDPGLSRLSVPAQQYAVVPCHGPIAQLEHLIDWFIQSWLPDSGYCGVNGFDLEVYPPNFEPQNPDARMEYWVPVTPCQHRHSPSLR